MFRVPFWGHNAQQRGGFHTGSAVQFLAADAAKGLRPSRERMKLADNGGSLPGI